MSQHDLASTKEGQALLSKLNARRKDNQNCVGYADDGSGRGQWVACADFAVGRVKGELVVAYQVAVMSNEENAIDGIEAVAPASEVRQGGMLQYYADEGYEKLDGKVEDKEQAANKRASDRFDAALRKAIASAEGSKAGSKAKRRSASSAKSVAGSWKVRVLGRPLGRLTKAQRTPYVGSSKAEAARSFSTAQQYTSSIGSPIRGLIVVLIHNGYVAKASMGGSDLVGMAENYAAREVSR